MPRILHLSDLQLRAADPGAGAAGDPEHDPALTALLALISRQRHAGTAPDLVLISGDLICRGDARAYAGVGRLLDRLRHAAGLPRKRVVCVPGGHDVDRGAGRRLQRAPRSAEDAAAFFADPAERVLHARKLAAYSAFIDGYFGLGTAAEATHTLQVGGLTVGIAALNTAWFAQDDDDREQLFVGVEGVRAAGRALQGCDLTVALLHHGPAWLHPLERAAVIAALGDGFDVCCHGQRGGLDEDGQRPVLAAGPGWAHPRRPALANVLTVEPAVLRLSRLRFRDGRWDEEGGRAYDLPLRGGPRTPDAREKIRTAPGKAGPQRDEEALQRYLEGIARETAEARAALCRPSPGTSPGAGPDKAAQPAGSPLLLADLYVPLPAHLINADGRATPGAPVERVAGLLGVHGRLLLLGEAGSGRTTTLRHLAGQLAQHALGQPSEAGGYGFPPGQVPLPVPLRLSDLLPTPASTATAWASDPLGVIEAVLATRCPAAEPGFARRCVLRRGALLLLDGLDALPEASWPILRAGLLLLHERAPVTRVLLCAPAASAAACLRLFGGGAAPFTAAMLLPLRLDERTQIIDRFVQEVSAIPTGVTLFGEAAGLNHKLRQVALGDSAAALAQHPLLLHALCWVGVRYGLPAQRAELIAACLGALVENRVRESPVAVGALVDELARTSDTLLGFRTAQTLAERTDPWPAVRPLLSDPGSYEALRLLGGLLARGSTEAGSRLLRALLSEAGGRMDPGERAQLVGLAAQLLAEMPPYLPDPKVARRVQEELTRLLQDLDDRVQRAPLSLRIAVAEGLGRAGDPRLPVDLLSRGGGRDPWVELPSGGGFAAVGMLRYPVTWAQLWRFAALSGHEPEGDGDVRAIWAAQAEERPSHPATLVSYDDALALCRYLTAVDFRYRYDLPTEAEWERALRQGSFDNRPYPWGSGMEPSYCNTGRRIGGTTPVGVFPAGTAGGGEGCADLIGNVWEWCQGDYDDDPTILDSDLGVSARLLPGQRIARGGSYLTTRAGALRAAFPAGRSEEIGVRLVRRSR